MFEVAGSRVAVTMMGIFKRVRRVVKCILMGGCCKSCYNCGGVMMERVVG